MYPSQGPSTSGSRRTSQFTSAKSPNRATLRRGDTAEIVGQQLGSGLLLLDKMREEGESDESDEDSEESSSSSESASSEEEDSDDSEGLLPKEDEDSSGSGGTAQRDGAADHATDENGALVLLSKTNSTGEIGGVVDGTAEESDVITPLPSDVLLECVPALPLVRHNDHRLSLMIPSHGLPELSDEDAPRSPNDPMGDSKDSNENEEPTTSTLTESDHLAELDINQLLSSCPNMSLKDISASNSALGQMSLMELLKHISEKTAMPGLPAPLPVAGVLPPQTLLDPGGLVGGPGALRRPSYDVAMMRGRITAAGIPFRKCNCKVGQTGDFCGMGSK